MRWIKYISVVICLGLYGFLISEGDDWGFFAHRLINKMAVFTLPPEMMYLYKPHLNFISAHAVDPDKRRYASRYEAVRHYIDLDSWGGLPFDGLPRTWSAAIMKHADLYMIGEDTSWVIQGQPIYHQAYSTDSVDMKVFGIDQSIASVVFRKRYSRAFLPGYYQEDWIVVVDSFCTIFDLDLVPEWKEIRVQEKLTEHGIAPYHLVAMQRKLTRFFIEGNVNLIVRTSADFGHYIGDAHVPLHTTKNYNGQLTDQLGIHAFWESRIPELFAENEYDFLTGKAAYIDDPVTYYWDIILRSHALVDSVLSVEKKLSQTYPSDQQYCFDQRLNATVRLQCRAYAKAYESALKGMVEERMRASIQAIGSAWYTAWIDAGQPSFGDMQTKDWGDNSEVSKSTEVIDRDIIRQHE
ncbi:MAG: hypothetical protein HKN87_03255 [Saprospiraceae bacterium]|nr:hypothetical protein [Saprospiraceae bacterium]